MKLISGNFIEASEYLSFITNNLYPEMMSVISENDFGFYSSLTLLINFRRNYLKEIVFNIN